VKTPVEPALIVFTGLLLATGIMRLIEAAVSARRIRLRRDIPVAEPWLFPMMVLLHVALVGAPLFEVLWFGRPFVPALAVAAGTVLILATALRVWTLRTIGRAWNVRILRPDPEAVVTTGPYAWIRHPNYLAVILEIVSLPLLHTAWIAALVLSTLNAVVLYRRIRVEEAELRSLSVWRETMANRSRLVPYLF
jgi:methyltransferase